MATLPSGDNPPTYTEATGGQVAAGFAPGPSQQGYGTVPGSNQVGYGQGYVQGAPPGYAQPPPGTYKQPTGGYQAGAVPGPYQGPPGYQPVSGQHPTYLAAPAGSTITVQPQPSVVVVGGCPACRIGVLEDDFTCLGVCCAIFFFPLGILCCLAMRQRRCPNCGAVFG